MDGDTANRPREELVREIEDLKRYETNFQAMIEGSLDAILVVDMGGAILYANLATERLFEMPRNRMIGAVFGFPIVLTEPVEMYVLRRFEKFVAVEMWIVQIQWKDRPAYLISL
jgi:PAS domain S-box-containing protein